MAMVGGTYCEIKIPVRELQLKMLGGLIREGGVYAGRYGTQYMAIALRVA